MMLCIGIGSGSTIVPFVEALSSTLLKLSQSSENGEDVKKRVICVPTSFQATQLINDNELCLGSLERYPELDLAVDGADEVLVATKAADLAGRSFGCSLIKGGGGCLTQEKIIAYAAKELWIICDESKTATYLGEKWKKGIPIEVIPMSYKMVTNKLKKICILDEKHSEREGQLEQNVEINLRMAQAKAGPVVTDSGNFILDAHFNATRLNDLSVISDLETKIKEIPGVVCTGLFIDMTSKVFVGLSNGSTDMLC